MYPAPLLCPHCGEPLETVVDEGGSNEQDYIEDCAVCCRPIRFLASRDPDTGEFSVRAESEQ